MYKDTVTIFNRLRSNGTDTWFPTVIEGVDLNVDASAIRKQYGADSNDRAKLHIKYNLFSENDEVDRGHVDYIVLGHYGIEIAGKKYFLPKSWDGTGITFHDGDLFDFFWEGEWAGVTETVNGVQVVTWNVNDEDYKDGFYNYMRKNHDMVFAITSVARYSVIPHFEIMGA